jgi:hypothetical protein
MIISCWDHPGNIGSGQGDLYMLRQVVLILQLK